MPLVSDKLSSVRGDPTPITCPTVSLRSRRLLRGISRPPAPPQVAFSLAVGEAAVEFEHRDLQWGNVLLREEPADHLPGLLRGRRYRLPTAGLRATLIDFTLSRLRADGAVVYNNLAEDPTLFSAHGDHQFEVYRQMRTATR